MECWSFGMEDWKMEGWRVQNLKSKTAELKPIFGDWLHYSTTPILHYSKVVIKDEIIQKSKIINRKSLIVIKNV
jgi:hypothetical protein